MRIGICLAGDGFRLREVGRLAARAEAAGFESVWLGEYWHSAFASAAAASQATSRVRIASGVVQAFPRTPLTTAIEALDADDLAGGRFVLGLGPQVRRYNERLHGIEYGKPAARMREYVSALRTLWTLSSGESPAYSGAEYYRFDLSGFTRPTPAVRPAIPIYLAAVRRQMTRLAGEIADGLVGHPLSSKADLAESRTWVAEGAARSGRDLSGFETAQLFMCSVSADRGLARREAALQIALYASTQTYAPRFQKLGYEAERLRMRAAYLNRDTEGMLAAVTDDIVDTFAVAGTPGDVVSGIQERALPGQLPVLLPAAHAVDPVRVTDMTAALIALHAG